MIGLGVGVAAVAAPLYGAEMAPAAWRGRFVSAYQLAITIGIFLAYLIDQALAATDHWRMMLGIAAVPGILLVVSNGFRAGIGALACQERQKRCRLGAFSTVLIPKPTMRRRLPRSKAACAPKTSRQAGALCSRPPGASRFSSRSALPMFQQITGINAIIYYADDIFARAGFATPEAQTMATTWAIGAVNVLATFIAIAFIDKLGRRPLVAGRPHRHGS